MVNVGYITSFFSTFALVLTRTFLLVWLLLVGKHLWRLLWDKTGGMRCVVMEESVRSSEQYVRSTTQFSLPTITSVYLPKERYLLW